jgi:hypothetical protein
MEEIQIGMAVVKLLFIYLFIFADKAKDGFKSFPFRVCIPRPKPINGETQNHSLNKID